jgi:hypothetical protein
MVNPLSSPSADPLINKTGNKILGKE